MASAINPSPMALALISVASLAGSDTAETSNSFPILLIVRRIRVRPSSVFPLSTLSFATVKPKLILSV